MEDRAYLQRQCNLRGNTILSRWKKKSRDKREACLLAADPGLFPDPWFHRVVNDSVMPWLEKRSLRSSWLLPYLSVETLKTCHTAFLCLLDNRVRLSPEEWVLYDTWQINPAWKIGMVDLVYCETCVIMQGPNYGQLTEWEKEAAHRWDIIGFPRAQLILEAQAHLMGFLRKIVEQLLEGVDSGTPSSSEKWTQFTNVGLTRVCSTETWSPFVSRSPSAPPFFEIDSLLEIAQTRLNATEDHLWLLQTDPAYLRRMIKVVGGGPLLAERPWHTYTIISNEILDSVMADWLWQWMLEECQNVKRQSIAVKEKITPGQPLPRQYDLALGALYLLSSSVYDARMGHLMTLVAHRPGFCHRYKFSNDNRDSFLLERKSFMFRSQMYSEDPLDWCLYYLSFPDRCHPYDVGMLFAFLNEYISNSPAGERERLDQQLYDKLSDYAANHKILMAGNFHRPQGSGFSIEDVQKNVSTMGMRHLFKDFDLPQEKVKELGHLLKEFDTLPAPSGKKDHAWLDRFFDERLALIAYWGKLRIYHHDLLMDLKFPSQDIDSHMKVLSSHLTRAQMDSWKALEIDIERKIATPRAIPTPGPIQTQWGPEQKPDAPPVNVKTKQKTRPEERQPEPVSEPEDALSKEEAPPIPKIVVNKRTFDILTKMFPASAMEVSKPIPWDSFVLAMTDARFSAKPNSGSSVIFEKEQHDEGEKGHGKIIFHKPHPVAKIDHVMLRSMGRRMRKHFGWERDVFVLAS